jgi:hypothetical protein
MWFSRRRFCVVGFVAVLLSGCGDGRPERVRVSGKVLIDNQPVTSGSVQFLPRHGGRPSSGKIQTDGSFSLFTFEERDGCPPGTYDVIVSSIEILNDTQVRYHLPKKYGSPQTSGISKTVDEPVDSMLIELTWDGMRGSMTETAR